MKVKHTTTFRFNRKNEKEEGRITKQVLLDGSETRKLASAWGSSLLWAIDFFAGYGFDLEISLLKEEFLHVSPLYGSR